MSDLDRQPHQYLIRIWFERRPEETRTLWAFSVTDAKEQIAANFRNSNEGWTLSYIGPVNPLCKCGKRCVCGEPLYKD